MIFGNKKINFELLEGEHQVILRKLGDQQEDIKNIKEFIEMITKFFSDIKVEDSKVFEAEAKIEKLSVKLDSEKGKNKKLYGEKGGLTKSNNKLKKENAELKQKLEEALSGAYLKRELKPDKTKSKQQMKVRNHVTSSQAKSILKSKNSEIV